MYVFIDKTLVENFYKMICLLLTLLFEDTTKRL